MPLSRTINQLPGGSTVIAQNAALSAVIALNQIVPGAFRIPSNWTAANLTFQSSDTEAGTFDNIYLDEGTEYTVTVAASRLVVLRQPLLLAHARFLKIRSGTSETPVNQTDADKTILIYGLEV